MTCFLTKFQLILLCKLFSEVSIGFGFDPWCKKKGNSKQKNLSKLEAPVMRISSPVWRFSNRLCFLILVAMGWILMLTTCVYHFGSSCNNEQLCALVDATSRKAWFWTPRLKAFWILERSIHTTFLVHCRVWLSWEKFHKNFLSLWPLIRDIK